MVSEGKHRHSNQVSSLQCARANKLIIYITMHKQRRKAESDDLRELFLRVEGNLISLTGSPRYSLFMLVTSY